MRNEQDVRRILAELAEEAPGAPDARRVLRHSRNRIARNALATTLAVALVASGVVAGWSRLHRDRIPPSGGTGVAGTADLYEMRPDGSALRPLLATSANETDPAFSPDGRRIAYVSGRDGNADIWVMDSDGSHRRRLTSGPESDFAPAWSPDGKKIAFFRTGARTHVLVVGATGGRPRVVAEDSQDPAWFLDGQSLLVVGSTAQREGMYKIPLAPEPGAGLQSSAPLLGPGEKIPNVGFAESPVFLRTGMVVFVCRYDSNDLCIVKTDGSGLVDITSDPGQDASPAVVDDEILFIRNSHLWRIRPELGRVPAQITFEPRATDTAPTYSKQAGIVVFSRRLQPPAPVFSMNADGSDIRQLSASGAIDGGAVASPNGKAIAFASSRDGYGAIYVAKADGTDPQRLTSNRAGDFRPGWSPDGSRIVFTSGRDGNNEIYVMNADGTDQRRLTINVSDDTTPTWAPSGQLIAFSGLGDEGHNVFLINSDGSGARQLTHCTDCQWPAFSPDGTTVAYSKLDNGRHDIYTVKLDGTGIRRVTHGPQDEWQLAWAPGNAILFADGGDIWSIAPAGSHRTQITHDPAHDYAPAWEPGGRILFNSDR